MVRGGLSGLSHCPRLGISIRLAMADDKHHVLLIVHRVQFFGSHGKEFVNRPNAERVAG